MFKRVKFEQAEGNCTCTYDGKDVSEEEAIRLLKNPNVISLTVTRMTRGEYLKGYKPINI
jgi:hypothetical protein